MPYCGKETLQTWLAEFDAGDPGRTAAYVADQEEVDGCDGGLVTFPLRTANASVYIQPRSSGSLDWCVTIEAPAADTTLCAERLRQLCHELSAAAILCDYLQGKAIELHVSEGS